MPTLLAAYEATVMGLMFAVGSLAMIEALAGDPQESPEKQLKAIGQLAESAGVAAKSFVNEYQKDKPASR